MSRLKPVPCWWCGNAKTSVWRDEWGDPHVACMVCASSGPAGRTKKAAVERWNEGPRTQEETAQPEVDQ